MKKLLVFHRCVAPYRVDFFNDLSIAFDSHIALLYKNIGNQNLAYHYISDRLLFEPDYFTRFISLFKRNVPIGYFKRIKKNKPDLLLVNEFSESCWASILFRLFLKKCFKIITICDDSAEIIRNSRNLHTLSNNIAVKLIDGVILCSKAAKDAYRLKYPDVKTFVMPIIQNEDNYYINIDTIKDRAKQLATEQDLIGKRVYLFVGRIAPEKNVLYLVESFIKQHPDNPENILYLIGDYIPDNQGYHAAVDACIKQADADAYILKIGRKDGDELKAWYYAGQVLVLPSVWEPFGAVTNEALLCGNYVMVSSVAGSTCLVDEENGEIIDVSLPQINFEKMNQRVPLLSLQYIDSKENKMKYSYKSCINGLLDWMNKL